jgi:hypothetical protein
MNFPPIPRAAGTCILVVLVCVCFPFFASAQNTVTGAFQGRVTNQLNDDPVVGASVTITEVSTNRQYSQVTDGRGEFFQGLLAPGVYRIRIERADFQTQEILMPLKIAKSGEVVPVPVSLSPLPAGATPAPVVATEPNSVRVDMNTTDARRDESFPEERIGPLPIGSTAPTRTLDELALLAPGVAPPPQTIGDVAGPGVGPGVGSAGQFAVNGMRSRANNFTVDGSDNNDEDIGVRRQGFVALTSQPVESVKEFQIITLLAPAQFGRNIGGQVNLVSKGGTSAIRGAVYGFFNSDELNARNYFDTDEVQELRALSSGSGRPVFLNGQQVLVANGAAGEDELNVFQGGAVIGGPMVPGRTFYFLSGEYQKINATREKSFAVPTVEQRGAFGTGATGINRDFFDPNPNSPLLDALPVGQRSAALLSLFPFPNNPSGIYGANTLNKVLPASARGVIFSGRIDDNFTIGGRTQSFTARYNFTDDDRDIPAVNEAIFGSVQAQTQTHNISLFLNSRLNDPDSDSRLFNQIRGSFGSSRLSFKELRDTSFLLASSFQEPFLLNARSTINLTRPSTTGPVTYANLTADGGTVEGILGPIGQVILGGFSPLGVDVFNFPQARVNKTLQIADELSWAVGRHNMVFGADIRQTSLESDLPRLWRPLVTFNGGPRVVRSNAPCQFGGLSGFFEENETNFCYLPPNAANRVVRPEDLLALGAASSFALTFSVNRQDAKADLRYTQFNFYAQDAWRVRPDLSLSFGLRYEYNTPVKEANGLIEDTFDDPLLAVAPGLRTFIEDREGIYDADLNNFGPRFGIAYSPTIFGRRTSVFRAGYGIFYDQVLGAVVNQSRNVYPRYVTLDLGGLVQQGGFVTDLEFSNPGDYALVPLIPLNSPGSVNALNPQYSLPFLLSELAETFPSALTSTLPSRSLDMPMAHHYSFIFEQQLTKNVSASVGYVGTTGENLLRFTTPNKGPGNVVVATGISVDEDTAAPTAVGLSIIPARREPTVGAVSMYESTASSRYDSLQAELRGRFASGLNFLVSYVYSKAEDDVSDVFDLAGASALPQDGRNLDAERGPANFDLRHRFTYDVIYGFKDSEGGASWLTNGLQFGTTGRFHTGQPFTVNSVVDVNFDGNLTDRLNSTAGLVETGDGRQPLQLTVNPASLLAPFGQEGSVGRNTFRAGKFLELDLSVAKAFSFGTRKILFRTDIFNFINRANFGIPVRFLEAPGFGRATNTVTPGRRIQFSLKYQF